MNQFACQTVLILVLTEKQGQRQTLIMNNILHYNDSSKLRSISLPSTVHRNMAGTESLNEEVLPNTEKPQGPAGLMVEEKMAE